MVIAGFTISVDFHYQVAVLAKEMNVNNTVIRWLAIGLAVNGIGVFVVAFLGLIGAVKLRKGCLIVVSSSSKTN